MSLPADTLHSINRELSHAQQAPAAFFAAWRQGVELAGVRYFGDGTAGGFACADGKWDLCPDTDLIAKALGVLSSGERTFLAAMASFYNAHDGGKLLKRAGFEGLADLCSLDLERRQIIAALLLNYEGW